MKKQPTSPTNTKRPPSPVTSASKKLKQAKPPLFTQSDRMFSQKREVKGGISQGMGDIMEMMKASMHRQMMEAEERAAIARDQRQRFEHAQQQQQAMAQQQQQMMLMMMVGMQQRQPQSTFTGQSFTGSSNATGNTVNVASPPRTVGSKSVITTDLTASATKSDSSSPKTPTPLTMRDFDSESKKKDG